MTQITVELGAQSYPIIVQSGVLMQSMAHLAPYVRNGRLLVITDSNVAEKIYPAFQTTMAAAQIETIAYILPAGESAKCWAQLEKLTDWLLDNQIERSDHIIALGGGVVGDITGFAAHIAKRGCSFVQIPTSLLAQVDSSVGGKTAINSLAGKNMIGAFHQPSLVLIDPSVLQSLPRRELAAGFAEIIKYGLIDDANFFDWCAVHVADFFAGNSDVHSQAIIHSVRAKARIVAADEKETTGVRALLNLGHTFGHALEADTGYSAKLLHGEAVGAGMALAFHYSERIGLCDSADAAKLDSVLSAAGLPTTLHEAGVTGSGESLVAHMLHDKKMAGGTLPFLLARGIGQTFLSKDVDLADLTRFMDDQRLR